MCNTPAVEGAIVCPNCGQPASGPGLYFAGDNTICNYPTHAGSTASEAVCKGGVLDLGGGQRCAVIHTPSRCPKCSHAAHPNGLCGEVLSLVGGISCNCATARLRKPVGPPNRTIREGEQPERA